MKKIRRSLPQRDAGSMAQGCAKKLGLLVLSIVAVLALLGPSRAAADQSSPVTQLQFLQMLVQMSGDTPKFSTSSTAADYVQWAIGKGMNAGWQPSAHLTHDVLARSLVQFFGMTPGKLGQDYARILAREGIVVPNSENPTRADLIILIETPLFHGRVPKPHHSPKKCPPGHSEDEPGDENHDCGLGEGHDNHVNPPLSKHEDSRGDDNHQGKNRD